MHGFSSGTVRRASRQQFCAILRRGQNKLDAQLAQDLDILAVGDGIRIAIAHSVPAPPDPAKTKEPSPRSKGATFWGDADD